MYYNDHIGRQQSQRTRVDGTRYRRGREHRKNGSRIRRILSKYL